MSDNVRIGRRGSVNVELEITGKQGHAAYPEKVDNPIHKISGFLNKISKKSGMKEMITSTHFFTDYKYKWWSWSA